MYKFDIVPPDAERFALNAVLGKIRTGERVDAADLAVLTAPRISNTLWTNLFYAMEDPLDRLPYSSNAGADDYFRSLARALTTSRVYGKYYTFISARREGALWLVDVPGIGMLSDLEKSKEHDSLINFLSSDVAFKTHDQTGGFSWSPSAATLGRLSSGHALIPISRGEGPAEPAAPAPALSAGFESWPRKFMSGASFSRRLSDGTVLRENGEKLITFLLPWGAVGVADRLERRAMQIGDWIWGGGEARMGVITGAEDNPIMQLSTGEMVGGGRDYMASWPGDAPFKVYEYSSGLLSKPPTEEWQQPDRLLLIRAAEMLSKTLHVLSLVDFGAAATARGRHRSTQVERLRKALDPFQLAVEDVIRESDHLGCTDDHLIPFVLESSDRAVKLCLCYASVGALRRLPIPPLEQRDAVWEIEKTVDLLLSPGRGHVSRLGYDRSAQPDMAHVPVLRAPAVWAYEAAQTAYDQSCPRNS